MPTITITLEDTLQDRVDGASEDFAAEARTEMMAHLDAWDADSSGWEILDALSLQDRMHEICDSATSVYPREIETAWFLYGSELERAYEDAGIGENPRENNGMTAIYLYIEQAVMGRAEDVLEGLRDEILGRAAVA